MNKPEVTPCEQCSKHRFDCAHVECPRRVHWMKNEYREGRQGPTQPRLQEEHSNPLA